MMSAPPRLFTTVAVLAGAALVVILIVMVAGAGRSSRAPRTLQIELQASGTVAQLYWGDDTRFVEGRSVRVPLQPVAGFQRVRFSLPSHGTRWLRFDPSDAPGEILIGTAQLIDSNEQLLGALDPDRFTPGSQIASISRQGAVTRVVTEPAATDPTLYATLACLDPPAPLENLSRVTPAALALVSVAVLALLIACLAVLGRQLFGQEPHRELVQTGPGTPPWTSGMTAIWLAALFLVVFSAKLLLIRDNAVTVPYWDQWDLEARNLYVPFNDCDLRWSQMFSFHNEHRPFFTRLLALDLLVVNGQWDPRLEQVVNAAMHALTAVLIAAMFFVANRRRRLDLIAFVCALVFAIPLAWDNTLMGVQSAFYLLLLFSVLALWLTTRYRAGSGSWWLGVICAASALFTSAGGIITILVIAGMAALNLATDRREWRGPVIALIVAAAVIGLGIMMASPPLAAHEQLRAHTASEFAGALMNNLAFPWVDRSRLAAIMWLPIVLVIAILAVRRARMTELERTIVGVGSWVLLNAAAVAYGRGAGAALPATRYMDFLSIGLVANAVALVAILDRAGTGRLIRGVALGAAAGWLVFAVVGVDRQTRQTRTDLQGWRPLYAAHAANVQRYIITGELAEFTSKSPMYEIPYPDPKALASFLRDPYIRRILPAAAREPIHLEPRAVTNDAFVPDGSPVKANDPLRRAWGSYSDRGRRAEGRFDSQPVAGCRRGQRLRFPVSGYLGLPHQYFAMKDLSSGRDVAIMPSILPREGWADAIVDCPDRPFAITAIDAAADSWFAFQDPVEVGWASLNAERSIRWSRALFLAALGLAAFAARWTSR